MESTNTMAKSARLLIVGDSGIGRSELEQVQAPTWSIRLHWRGQDMQLSLMDLCRRAVQEITFPITCVSSGAIYRPAGHQPRFAGIELRDWLLEVWPEFSTTASWLDWEVQFRSAVPGAIGPTSERHSTSLPLREVLKPANVWLVWELNGQPLPMANGGPVRTLVRDCYFYKSLKWITQIQLMPSTSEVFGTWERYAAYHPLGLLDGPRFYPYLALRDEQGIPVPVADPLVALDQLFTEQHWSRVVTARLHELVPFTDDPRWQSNLIFQDRDKQAAALRGLVFRKQPFAGWDFTGVNFSLTQFLSCSFAATDTQPGAKLDGCDLEGASFYNCDLRGVSLRDAYLTGTTFAKKSRADPGWSNASDVTGLDVTGAVGLTTEAAAWLTDRGARGAAATTKPEPTVSGQLPWFVESKTGNAAEWSDWHQRWINALAEHQQPPLSRQPKLIPGTGEPRQWEIWLPPQQLPWYQSVFHPNSNLTQLRHQLPIHWVEKRI